MPAMRAITAAKVRPRRVRVEDPRTVRADPKHTITNPGEKYHTPPNDKMYDKQWPTISESLNINEKNREAYGRHGRRHVAAAAAPVALAAAAVPFNNKMLDRQTAKINATKAKTAPVTKAMPRLQNPLRIHRAREIFDPANPGVRNASTSRSVHNITAAGNPGHPADVKKPPMERLGESAARRQENGLDTMGMFMGAGMVAGGGVLQVGTHQARKRNEAATKKKAEVGKKFQPELLTSRAGLKKLNRTYGNEIKRGVAVGGAGLAVGSAGQVARHKSNSRAQATATVAGAGAAQVGYRAAAFTAVDRAAKQKAASRAGNTPHQNREQDRVWRDHQRKHNLRPNVKMSGVNARRREALYRDYPMSLPGAKAQRFAAKISEGRTKGMVLAGGLTAAGATLAGETSHLKDKKPVTASKALYQQESRPSMLRTLELGAGLGVAGWGLGRSRMLGAALGRGVKAASSRNNDRAVYALRMAQNAQGLLRRGTAPGERAVRQIRAVNAAINAVPASMRPEVAAAAGLLMTGNSHPVNRTSYRPVSTQFGRAY